MDKCLHFLGSPDVLNLLTFLIVIAAGLSAWAAKRAAKETRTASQLSVMNSLFGSYSDEEMRDALHTLLDWAEEHGKSFAGEYQRLIQQKDPQVEDVDKARRRISHHFEKIYALWDVGGLDEKVVRRLATKDQVTLWLNYVEPLEEALNPQYEQSAFRKLGALYNIPKRQQS